MKHDYELTDTVKFYIVTCQEDGFREPVIKAWSDDKELVDFYMRFHGMQKKFTVKATTCTYQEMVRLINTNCRNDEIEIMHLLTAKGSAIGKKVKHRDGKPEMITVGLPLTMHDKALVDDSAKDFCSLIIDYGYLHKNIRFLKDKYLNALHTIGLPAVIDITVMNQSSKFTRSIDMDELMILLKLSPGDFR